MFFENLTLARQIVPAKSAVIEFQIKTAALTKRRNRIKAKHDRRDILPEKDRTRKQATQARS
jgi:hypothetical protein